MIGRFVVGRAVVSPVSSRRSADTTSLSFGPFEGPKCSLVGLGLIVPYEKVL